MKERKINNIRTINTYLQKLCVTTINFDISFAEDHKFLRIYTPWFIKELEEQKDWIELIKEHFIELGFKLINRGDSVLIFDTANLANFYNILQLRNEICYYYDYENNF